MSPIRIATLADLSHLARLDAACFCPGWSEKVYSSLLESPASTALIIEGRAFAVWSIAACGPLGSECELLRLGVTPQARRSGLARALVEWQLERLEGVDSKVFLEVRPSNLAAVELYRSLRFVEIGSRPGYYGDGEDALLMRYCRSAGNIDRHG